MKQNRTFCIETELVEKLKKETNQSEIVNKALEAYFGGNTTMEDLKKEKTELEGQIEIINRKIEKLEKQTISTKGRKYQVRIT